MSELRRTKRYLLRKGDSKDRFQTYADNKGIEYDYKWIAKLSSFYNMFMGCLKNGFPIVVPKLWYNAWAFYPFFFIRKDLRTDDPITVLNHERIHIRQQVDIHLTFSLPIIIGCLVLELLGDFNPLSVLWVVPFIPTIIYGVGFIRSWANLISRNRKNGLEKSKVTFSAIRENTSFERESISKGPNANYLYTRKFWAVLAYTGWGLFKNYGITSKKK